MNNRFRLCILFAICLISTSSSAVGTFSRACRFDTIPAGGKAAAAKFLVYAGADASFANMANRPQPEQANYWILEGLTTDYFSPRYYLFVASAVYQWDPPPTDTGWWKVNEWRSKWASEQVTQAVKNDPILQPYYVTRPGAYNSARSNPEIYTYLGSSNYYYAIGDVRVVSIHFYYDPVSKQTIRLPNTSASDCNLVNWGFGMFDR